MLSMTSVREGFRIAGRHLIRGFFKLGFWGAEIAAFRGLGEPEFCRPQLTIKPAAEADAEVPETSTSSVEPGVAATD